MRGGRNEEENNFPLWTHVSTLASVQTERIRRRAENHLLKSRTHECLKKKQLRIPLHQRKMPAAVRILREGVQKRTPPSSSQRFAAPLFYVTFLRPQGGEKAACRGSGGSSESCTIVHILLMRII